MQPQHLNTGPLPANVLGNMWGRFWNSLYQHMVPYPDVASVDPSEELRKQASTVPSVIRFENYFNFSPAAWIMLAIF